jgi:hypothetical protein
MCMPAKCFVPQPCLPASTCCPLTIPEGASRCAPGFYSAKGSKKPCQQCPAGRTTADLQSKQKFITQCYVKDGFGVVNSTANSTDAFNPDTSALNDTQKAALAVLECPIGYYSSQPAGNAEVALKCQACPAGSSTKESGRTDLSQCDGECRILPVSALRSTCTEKGPQPVTCLHHIKDAAEMVRPKQPCLRIIMFA